MYTQNGELWQYASELAEAHARNANMVKDQVQKLHGELWRVYQERSALASKLELAQNSKELLGQIGRELKSAQLSVAEENRLRLEAELALSSARAENDMHDEMLQRKADTMQSLHWQLDDSARRHDEFESLDRAEDFFSTSRAVLRSAYVRFKASVVGRLRLTRLRRILETVRARHLWRHTWGLWVGYVQRRRFMHMMDMTRTVQLLARCLSHWKIHSAVERLAAASRRRQLLRKVFCAWAREASSQRFEQWAGVVTDRFRQRQRLRRAFSGWEGLCRIKCWRMAPQVLLQCEARADTHFGRRVIRMWRDVARASRQALAMLAGPGLQTRLAQRVLSGWKELCQGLWRRRGHLLKRFFLRSQQMVRQSKRRHALRHNAIALWAWLRKRSCLRRWARRIRRPRGVLGRQSSRRLVSYRQRRVLQSGFSVWTFGCAALKRLRVCLRAAESHFFVRGPGGVLFRLWRRRARQAARRRLRARTELLSGVMCAWKRLVPMERRERRIEATAERMHETSRHRALVSLLGRWRRLARCQVALRARRQLLETRTLRSVVRRRLAHWKGRWATALYWRSRELREDASRLQALTRLRQHEHEDLVRELTELRLATAEQAQSVSALQAQLDARESALRDAEASLEARRRDKAELEAALVESRAQLDAAVEERRRMRAVEQALAVERARDAKALEQRKREAEGILNKLVAESAALRAEAEAARAQADEAELGAARDVEREQALLVEAQNAAAAMEGLARQRESATSRLALEQQQLDGELERVQRRLDDAIKDGEARASLGEQAQRQRASELRLLRTDAGLVEARVAELRRIVLERRQQLGVVEVSRVLEGEQRCVSVPHTPPLCLLVLLFVPHTPTHPPPSPPPTSSLHAGN